jgi:hypothetical protein
MGPGIVAHDYNLNYLGSMGRNIMVQVQPRKNVNKTLSQQVSKAWWYKPVISGMWEEYAGWLLSEAGSGKKHKTIFEE